MNLKSPTEMPVHVALLSGHAISIDQNGREVPQMFLKEAFAKGAIPVEVDATEFDQDEKNDVEKGSAELLVAGVKKMLVENQDDFTGAGLPNRKVLSAIVGWSVSAEELAVAWASVQEAAEQQ